MIKCSGIGLKLWCGLVGEVARLAVRWVVDTGIGTEIIVVTLMSASTTN